MSLTGKDHKDILNLSKGPKRRVLGGANEGPNVRASNMGAKNLYSAANLEEFKTECQSTKELQAETEVLNISIDRALIGEKFAAI